MLPNLPRLTVFVRQNPFHSPPRCLYVTKSIFQIVSLVLLLRLI